MTRKLWGSLGGVAFRSLRIAVITIILDTLVLLGFGQKNSLKNLIRWNVLATRAYKAKMVPTFRQN